MTIFNAIVTFYTSFWPLVTAVAAGLAAGAGIALMRDRRQAR